MGKTKGNSKARTRSYAFIVYPDSAYSNWLDRLDHLHLSAFVSPLHDCDVNPTGELKKAHYHVLIMFDSVKTLEQANDVYLSVVGEDGFRGNGCDIVRSTRAYARYLCHLDNLDKFQYSISSVRCLGGADYNLVISSSSDKYKAIREMISFINETGIVNFCELLDYTADNREDWFMSLCDNSCYVIKEYMKSYNYFLQKNGDS